MRVTVKLSTKDKNHFEEVRKDPLLKNKKTTIRMAISLGLLKMAQGKRAELKGNKIIKFNTGTIDPEGIFRVVAYLIIAKRLGASTDKNKIIIATKQELAENLAEAFVLGLAELYSHQWS